MNSRQLQGLLQAPGMGDSVENRLWLPVGGRQLDGVDQSIGEASALVHVELLVEALWGGGAETAVEAAQEGFRSDFFPAFAKFWERENLHSVDPELPFNACID